MLHDTIRSGNAALDAEDLEAAATARGHALAMTEVLGINPLSAQWSNSGSSAADAALAQLIDRLLAASGSFRAGQQVAERAMDSNALERERGITILAKVTSLNWKDIDWIRSIWPGKLILKGILDVEDAELAAKTGAQALVVSNHGGRQLDGAPSSIEVLPDGTASIKVGGTETE